MFKSTAGLSANKKIQIYEAVMMNVNICLRLAQHVMLVWCFSNTVGLTFKEIIPQIRSVSVFLSEMRGCNAAEIV